MDEGCWGGRGLDMGAERGIEATGWVDKRMARQTGPETAHYGRRMRVECDGSGLLDTINIVSNRQVKPASEKANDGTSIWTREKKIKEGGRSAESKGEPTDEETDNNAHGSNDIQLNPKLAKNTVP